MKPKHQPCACGCSEMADECMNPHNPNPLGAFTVDAIVSDMTEAFIQTVTEHLTWREAERILRDDDSGKSNHP